MLVLITCITCEISPRWFFFFNLIIESKNFNLDISVRNTKIVSICLVTFFFFRRIYSVLVTWLLTPESINGQKVNLVQAYRVENILNSSKTKSFMQFGMS